MRSVRSGAGEVRVSRLLIRSDVRLVYVDGVPVARRALQHREQAQQADVHASETRIIAAPTPPAVSTRAWVSFSEPFLLALTTKALTCPLRAFLRNPRPSDATMCSAAWRLSKLARTIDSYAGSTSGAMCESSRMRARMYSASPRSLA